MFQQAKRGTPSIFSCRNGLPDGRPLQKGQYLPAAAGPPRLLPLSAAGSALRPGREAGGHLLRARSFIWARTALSSRAGEAEGICASASSVSASLRPQARSRVFPRPARFLTGLQVSFRHVELESASREHATRHPTDTAEPATPLPAGLLRAVAHAKVGACRAGADICSCGGRRAGFHSRRGGGRLPGRGCRSGLCDAGHRCFHLRSTIHQVRHRGESHCDRFCIAHDSFRLWGSEPWHSVRDRSGGSGDRHRGGSISAPVRPLVPAHKELAS